MILLPENQYFKALKPLKEVEINHLFARWVIEGYIKGRVYVDNIADPRCYYVIHPYGMSLLFGELDNKEFNSCLYDYFMNSKRVRDNFEWLQVFPRIWETKVQEVLGEQLVKFDKSFENILDRKIVEYTRVNFVFDSEKYHQRVISVPAGDFQIVRTTGEMFEDIKGTVVPRHFWQDADQFNNKGVGFTLIYMGKPASTAYSAFILDNKLEIGIETMEEFRGLGFAEHTCSALIDFCLENNYEPIWSCRFENTGSYNLAQKLGFKPSLYVPFYRLIN